MELRGDKPPTGVGRDGKEGGVTPGMVAALRLNIEDDTDNVVHALYLSNKILKLFFKSIVTINE